MCIKLYLINKTIHNAVITTIILQNLLALPLPAILWRSYSTETFNYFSYVYFIPLEIPIGKERYTREVVAMVID